MSVSIARLLATRRRWTEAERAIVRERWGKDTPIEIACQLDRTEMSIRHAAYALGLQRPRIRTPLDHREEELQRLYDAGLSDYAIAREMGIKRISVWCWRLRKRLKATHQRVDEKRK